MEMLSYPPQESPIHRNCAGGAAVGAFAGNFWLLCTDVIRHNFPKPFSTWHLVDTCPLYSIFIILLLEFISAYCLSFYTFLEPHVVAQHHPSSTKKY